MSALLHGTLTLGRPPTSEILPDLPARPRGKRPMPRPTISMVNESVEDLSGT